MRRRCPCSFLDIRFLVSGVVPHIHRHTERDITISFFFLQSSSNLEARKTATSSPRRIPHPIFVFFKRLHLLESPVLAFRLPKIFPHTRRHNLTARARESCLVRYQYPVLDGHSCESTALLQAAPAPLPQELIDTIIDESQYDVSTLISLTSASRCCARARIHLYRAIDLSQRSSAIRFFHLCVMDDRIRSYVQSIFVETLSTPDYTDFHHILQSLTEVQELTISGEYECIPPVLRGVFMTYNLSALTLKDMEFDYADLQAFVRPYPTLRRLSAFEVKVEEQVAPNAAENGQRSLESLSLSQTDFLTRASKGIGHGIPFILADIRRLVLMNTMASLNDLQQMLHVVHQPLEELYIYEPLILSE